MAQENEILQTPGIEEKIMRATGLTKNVVAKMLCNANETEDEVEKARILSHFIWHMPGGQLQATPEAKAVKKELIQELANEIGTEMPEEWSSLEIEVSKPTGPEIFDDGITPVPTPSEPTDDKENTSDEPTTDNEVSVPEGENEGTQADDAELKQEEDTNSLLFKFAGKKEKSSKKKDADKE